MKEELLKKIAESGHRITEEIKSVVEDLHDVLSAQKEGKDDITPVLAWLEEKRQAHKAQVEEIGVRDLVGWRVDPKTGNIAHETGKFFSIIGVKVQTAAREVASWTQPLMKQEECGILGILSQKQNGIRHYLLYAKFEPGSIAGLQLSPTLQATESNLEQSHGGKKPLFAEFFEKGGRGNVLVNAVHVEDPGRFYHKTNRCMIVEISEKESLSIPHDFIWLTLPQIKKLLKIDNIVNALTRSVLGSK